VFDAHGLQLTGELTDLLKSLPRDEQDKRLNYIVTVRKGVSITTKPARLEFDAWAEGQAKVLENSLETFYMDTGSSNIEGFAAVRSVVKAGIDSGGDLSALRVPGALEYYFALGAPGSINTCVKCHVMPVATNPSPTSQPSTSPLEPLPTGLANGPRRWFSHSLFDHNAHRSMLCRECHESAVKSEDMGDVALPSIETCVRCHHGADARGPGAGDTCQECHIYHNRTLEHKPFGFKIADLLTDQDPKSPNGSAP
jgi:hypothetical protein